MGKEGFISLSATLSLYGARMPFDLNALSRLEEYPRSVSHFRSKAIPKDFRGNDVPDTFAVIPWPKTVPDDLRRKLEAVLDYRNRPAPQDVWGAVLEWLEAEGIKPTEHTED